MDRHLFFVFFKTESNLYACTVIYVHADAHHEHADMIFTVYGHEIYVHACTDTSVLCHAHKLGISHAHKLPIVCRMSGASFWFEYEYIPKV